jgi:cytochrome c peroxidase
VLLAGYITFSATAVSMERSDKELELLSGMLLSRQPPPPQDRSNRHERDPRAIALGEKLFSNTRLSARGDLSCATCHVPNLQFQDGKSHRRSLDGRLRRTQSLIGVAYAPWLFWDGRKDSLWSQALAPLEDPLEHGATRARIAHVMKNEYAADYEAIFGKLPNLATVPPDAGPSGSSAAVAGWNELPDALRDEITRVFVNTGKSIAAFVKTLRHAPSRFDEYVRATESGSSPQTRGFNAEEEQGLTLFLGKARCVQCHSGPLLTDHFFYSTRVPPVDRTNSDPGRSDGEQRVLKDEFNCLSRYSDAQPVECEELRFISLHQSTMRRAFKVPSLRGVADRAPYMHAGQFGELRAVLEHYVRAPESDPASFSKPGGHSQGSALLPLPLTEQEIGQLSAFLRTLGPVRSAAGR